VNHAARWEQVDTRLLQTFPACSKARDSAGVIFTTFFQIQKSNLGR
jgi:hypothetical protein